MSRRRFVLLVVLWLACVVTALAFNAWSVPLLPRLVVGGVYLVSGLLIVDWKALS